MHNKTRIEKISPDFFKELFPDDLKVALVWLAAGIVVSYLPRLNESPIWNVLILPGILFLPIYCLISARIPKNSDIFLSERIALSFGLSITVVPLIAPWLHFTRFGISPDPILPALSVFILVMILIAHYRKSLLPSEERFRVPFFEVAGTTRNPIFSKGGSKVDRIITVILFFAVLAAVLATVYVIVVPKEGERFTEFFILGEKHIAADYPDLIITGQNYPMFVGVGNQEYRNVAYTIETWMVYTEFDTVTNTPHIIAMDPKDRLSLNLAHNETAIIPYNLSFEKTGYNRVEFLLFNESVPGLDVTGSDRINASYRDLHLGVTVEEAEYEDSG